MTRISFSSTIPNLRQSPSFPEDEVDTEVIAKVSYDEGEMVEGRRIVPSAWYADIESVTFEGEDGVTIEIVDELPENIIERLEEEALVNHEAEGELNITHLEGAD